MLILARRIGEKLIIGEDIEVAVLGINGNQVCIGIKAPDYISIHREELYLRIKEGQEKEERGKKLTIQYRARKLLAPSDHLLRKAIG